MLASPRIAEISEHPIAHVLGDETAITFDQFGTAAMIGADDLPKVLPEPMITRS
jgi:hypothetical protein